MEIYKITQRYSNKGIPTKYEFEACEAEKYIYQLDFVCTKEDTTEYHQLLKDAGWVEMYKWPGMNGIWYYFERVDDGAVKRIYTDNDSKIQLTEKLIKSYGLFSIVFAMLNLSNTVNSVNRVIDTLNGERFNIIYFIMTGIALFACVLMVFCLYMTFSLIISKKKLKEKTNKL